MRQSPFSILLRSVNHLSWVRCQRLVTCIRSRLVRAPPSSVPAPPLPSPATPTDSLRPGVSALPFPSSRRRRGRGLKVREEEEEEGSALTSNENEKRIIFIFCVTLLKNHNTRKKEDNYIFFFLRGISFHYLTTPRSRIEKQHERPLNNDPSKAI